MKQVRVPLQSIDNLMLSANSQKSSHGQQKVLDGNIKIPKLKKQIHSVTIQDNITESNTNNSNNNDKFNSSNKKDSGIIDETMKTPMKSETTDDDAIQKELKRIRTIVNQTFMALDPISSCDIIESIRRLENLLLSSVSIKQSTIKSILKNPTTEPPRTMEKSAVKSIDKQVSNIWRYNNDNDYEYNYGYDNYNDDNDIHGNMIATGVLHWHAVDDVVFMQSNQFTPSKTLQQRNSCSDGLLETVMKKTPSRNHLSPVTPITRSQSKMLRRRTQSPYVDENVILEYQKQQRLNEDCIDNININNNNNNIDSTYESLIHFCTISRSPEIMNINDKDRDNRDSNNTIIMEPEVIKPPTRRRGRRASVGGKKIKHLKSDDQSPIEEQYSSNNYDRNQTNSRMVSFSPITNDSQVIIRTSNVSSEDKTIVSESTPAVTLRRSRRRESLGIKSNNMKTERNSNDSVVITDRRRSSDYNIENIPMIQSSSTKKQKTVVSITKNSSTLLQNRLDNKLLDYLDFSSLMGAKESVEERIKLSGLKDICISWNTASISLFALIVLCRHQVHSTNLLVIIEIVSEILKYDISSPESYENKKSVRFRHADISCSSPPNDRRPSSWEAAYDALHRIKSIITVCSEAQKNYIVVNCISEMTKELIQTESLEYIRSLVQIPFFSISEAKSTIEMIQEEVCYQKNEVITEVGCISCPSCISSSSLRSRLSWIASSIIRFHLRWLLDPLPAEISTPAVASINLSTSYRSSFYLKNVSIHETLLHWFSTLSLEDEVIIPNDTWSKRPTDPSDITMSFILSRALKVWDTTSLVTVENSILSSLEDAKMLLLKDSARTFITTLLELNEFKSLEVTYKDRFHIIMECSKDLYDYGTMDTKHWTILKDGINSLRYQLQQFYLSHEVINSCKITLQQSEAITKKKQTKSRGKKNEMIVNIKP